jgi:uncharacterized protein (DUF488 family)
MSLRWAIRDERIAVVSGYIYTVGYAAADAVRDLEGLMADPAVLLIDIRLAARSQWFPQWTKKRLRLKWGDRYRHMPALGNVNYRDHRAPIELADPATGLAAVQGLLADGWSVVLLCACANYERCHRKLVVDLLLHPSS